MRIVIIEFMSIDGVVQAPGGPDEDTDGGFAHGGWTHPFFDQEVVGGAFAGALGNADALLFGRRTWQTMAAAWPDRAGDPFADQMNGIAKYVVSSTLGDDELTWNNTTLIPGDRAVAAHPRAARGRRRRPGRDGQPDARAAPCCTRASPTSSADRDAGAPRWRQEHLPRGRRAAHARARLRGHERGGRAGVHLPAGRRGVAGASQRPGKPIPVRRLLLPRPLELRVRLARVRRRPPPRSRRTALRAPRPGRAAARPPSAPRPSRPRTARRRPRRRHARSRPGSGRSPIAGAAAPRPRRAAFTRRTARGTPPVGTRSGRGSSARPACRTLMLMPTCSNQASWLSKTHPEPKSSEFSHVASRTLSTNHPSSVGARPEPESSSRASFMRRA